MRKEGEARKDLSLLVYANIVDAFADYFENRLPEALENLRALIQFFFYKFGFLWCVFSKTGLVIGLRKKGEVVKARSFCENELIPKCGAIHGRLLVLALNIYAILLQECDETEKAIRFSSLEHLMNLRRLIRQVELLRLLLIWVKFYTSQAMWRRQKSYCRRQEI